jgi:NAD(P)-dependent dehydrogenase (short-subunit alcohol dehydrogenase family)
VPAINRRTQPTTTTRGAVVITGSGSGIGAATALWLNEKGHLVFAGLRKMEQGQALLASAVHADDLIPVFLDVTKADAIASARETVTETLAARGMQLTGLVNNAADENLGPVEVLPLEVFRSEIEVGYLGTVAVTKAFLPLLRQAAGRIVNVSSINGRCTFKYHATTCATKYAVEALSDALRMELKPWGMHVAVVEPGPTDTPLMTDKTVEEFTRKLAQYPEEVRNRYFPDFDVTIRKVTEFVENLKKPPAGVSARFRRLINGQGWLHSPLEVARVIEHAMRSPRPKTRYLVGIQAKLIYFVRRLLGDRAFDRFLGEKVFDF